MRLLTQLKLIIAIISTGICMVCGAEIALPLNNIETVEQLYKELTIFQKQSTLKNQERLKRFTNAKAQQATLVEEAKASGERLRLEGKILRDKIDVLQQELLALNSKKKKRLGNFGELFGVTRQVAKDTQAQLVDSLISAQYPDRHLPLSTLSTTTNLPDMKSLETLWLTLLHEQIEQGNLARFEASLGDEDAETTSVMRFGPFNAYANGKFLSYQAESQKLVELGKQPNWKFRKTVDNLGQLTRGEVNRVAIDPSRGTILGMMIQSPTLLDRFHQGGIPGYVVTVLAIFGILLGLVRVLQLNLTANKVKRQIRSQKVVLNNPLGRILRIYEDNSKDDIVTIEHRLDEALAKETPALEKGLNLLKVLAAIAPLIGLLGTVVGMILTFQVITMWGTGEPKLMAGGISQALVTTVQGLIAAIPLMLLHSMAQSRSAFIQGVLQEQSMGLIATRSERSHA